jgi:hypothetical protein
MLQPVFNLAALGLSTNQVVGWNGTTLVSTPVVFASSGVLTQTSAGAAGDTAVRLRAHASQSANILEVTDSAGANVRARVTSARTFSNNGGQTNAEVFGANATVSGAGGLAIGAAGTTGPTAGTYGVAIGSGLTTGASCTNAGVAIGGGNPTGAIVTGVGIAIGLSTNSAGGEGIAIGPYASTAASGGISLGPTNAGTSGVMAFKPSPTGTTSQPATLLAVGTSATLTRDMWHLNGTWVVATDASRTSRCTFRTWDTASREIWRGEASGTAPMIGFLGANAAIRQTSGANLTNNVTAGGTNDTIANYTIVDYATDAAAIRNNLHQLARTLKITHDAMRLYGLLT